jgi:hypothetical protein
MKSFINSKKLSEQASQIDDAEDTLQLNELVNESSIDRISKETEEILIPVPFRMLRKISHENRVLRKYLLNYCRNNKVAGFEPFKEAPVDFNHSAKYDPKGRLKADLTTAQIEDGNKPIEPVYPKQYSLDELILLKEAAKAEDAKSRDDRAKGLK